MLDTLLTAASLIGVVLMLGAAVVRWVRRADLGPDELPEWVPESARPHAKIGRDSAGERKIEFTEGEFGVRAQRVVLSTGTAGTVERLRISLLSRSADRVLDQRSLPLHRANKESVADAVTDMLGQQHGH